MADEEFSRVLHKPFEALGGPLQHLTLGDFWSWAYSDLLNNRNRSVLAEFFVGTSLGIATAPRVEWDAVDFKFRGKKIEVKSSAYLQTWNIDEHERLRRKQPEVSRELRHSKIVFGVGAKKGWDSETNRNLPTPTRSADCYVFCLYPGTDPAAPNLLDPSCWEFYVVPTQVLDERFPTAEHLTLEQVRSLSELILYRLLGRRIQEATGLLQPWHWTEGPVDATREHVTLSFGPVGEDVVVARAAPATESAFAVQFLGEISPEARAAVTQDLHLYLVEHAASDTNPWAYIRYHATTGANLYGPVHWHWVPAEPRASDG